jgi:hypothetical protein
MVQGNQKVADQDLNGAGQRSLASAESMIGAATRGTVVSTGEVRGVTAATQAASNGLGYEGRNGVGLSQTMHNLGVVGTIYLAGAAAILPGPAAIKVAGVGFVAAGIANHDLEFQY